MTSPVKPTRVNAVGMMSNCTYCLKHNELIYNVIWIGQRTPVHFSRIAAQELEWCIIVLTKHIRRTVKSGILIERVAYIPNALFRALSHAQSMELPLNDEPFEARLILGGTLIIAQIRIAIHAKGTIMDFAVKKCRIFCGETSMNGSWISQYIK
jgi:hypothetical protein